VFAHTRAARVEFVEEIANEHAAFAVRVDVNHPNHVYAKNDLLAATVTSSEDGYLYLFYRDATGNVAVLFPNRFQKENAVRKNVPVTVPAPGSNFQVRIDAPFGNEMLKAVVSKKPLTYIDNTDFTGADMTPVGDGTAKNFSKSFEKETPDWAEHQVFIRTVDSNGNSPHPPISPDKGKRFAVAIGVSDYKDSRINNLRICHVDAEKMLDVFTKRCGVEKSNSLLITNEKATLANIRKTLKEEMPKLTQPGDTVFLFWSGHGGQTEDGKQEFLVPHDGSGDDIKETMLMDEMFGRWIQELDGRKVLIILDACHSGGMAANAKTLSKSLSSDDDWQPLRFAFTQLAVAKSVGQKDAALIASSTSSEVSFVRKEWDLSVLSYFVPNAIEDSKNPLTHVQLCETVKPKVARYIEQNFEGKKQTIVMQDDMTEPLALNP
jgi:hypothetical protein